MFKKTYESLTAQLRKLIDDLHDYGDEQLDLGAEHHAKVEHHAKQREKATDEHNRAKNTAAKIAALLDD